MYIYLPMCVYVGTSVILWIEIELERALLLIQHVFEVNQNNKKKNNKKKICVTLR